MIQVYDILICDDEPTIRNGLKHLIESGSMKLNVAGTASNGFEACRLIKELKPEVVLIDINMPGLTGLEVMREVSVHAPFTKFIIVSGYDEFQYAQQAIQLKAFDYLLKPIDKNNLFVVIEKACSCAAKEKKAYAVYPALENLNIADETVDYIYKNYADSELSLSSISKKLHVSESYLTRIIKKKTNMSFSELLTKLRMEEAISLILSDCSISSLNLSEKTGYKSQHYFCKVFKSYTGMTPTEYRKNHM
jgi:two-component system response regulator YesN